jgi:hypothetical protein
MSDSSDSSDTESDEEYSGDTDSPEGFSVLHRYKDAPEIVSNYTFEGDLQRNALIEIKTVRINLFEACSSEEKDMKNPHDIPRDLCTYSEFDFKNFWCKVSRNRRRPTYKTSDSPNFGHRLYRRVVQDGSIQFL